MAFERSACGLLILLFILEFFWPRDSFPWMTG